MYNSYMPKGRTPINPRTEFGERLFELREQSGLTQKEVAEHLGVSTRAYAFWERKPIALHTEQIAKLADVFGVSADVIVGREAGEARRNGPKGRLEKMFEEASELSRAQQEQVIAVLKPFVSAHRAAAEQPRESASTS